MTKKEFLLEKLNFIREFNPNTYLDTLPKQVCNYHSCLLLPLDINPFTAETIIDRIDNGLYSIAVMKYYMDYIPYLVIKNDRSDIFMRNILSGKCMMCSQEYGCLFLKKNKPIFSNIVVINNSLPISIVTSMDLSEMWFRKRNVMNEVISHYSSETPEELFYDSLKGFSKCFLEKLLNGESINEYEMATFSKIEDDSNLQFSVLEYITDLANENGQLEELLYILSNL